MGFIKNFRRDFAQAVNELLPDGEEKAGKKKKESRQNAEDAELLRPAADVKPQEPVRDANVQDAVSEGDTVEITVGEKITAGNTDYPIAALPDNLLEILNAGGLVKAMRRRNGLED